MLKADYQTAEIWLKEAKSDPNIKRDFSAEEKEISRQKSAAKSK